MRLVFPSAEEASCGFQVEWLVIHLGVVEFQDGFFS